MSQVYKESSNMNPSAREVPALCQEAQNGTDERKTKSCAKIEGDVLGTH